MFISISPHIRYNWATLLRSWLVQNRVLLVLLAELLKSTSQRLTAHYEGQPYPDFLLGVILSLANTYAFYGPRRFNLPFWMWLAAMLLLHLRLVSAPMSWQIIQMGGSSIPWFAAAHFIFTVATCLVVTANSLEPGQSRIPLQHARVETRPLHDVFLVSSTAFGPPWLRRGLKTWFPRLPMLLNRRVPWLVSVAQGYNRIMNDYHIPIFFLIFVLSMSLLLIFWKLHDLLSFWSLGGFQTALSLSNAIFRTSVDSHARLPSFEQLWLHQALRIDGRYYELTWMHFFADSTTLSDSAVEDDESYAQHDNDADGNAISRRAILSERRIG
ncbi:unnamed protein product [Clonostachys rhizophaga]|uniref:Uncharacterized protein n=1 Tax=Clonostachys rhizophaga TaxID=160324 RepID=A0A9N9VLW5_9HYPO|nr:unnamed protein product [Clonostachys rhizophaga]